MANTDSDDFRLSNPHIWTEAHHTEGGGSIQRMRLDQDNIVLISVGITTVKVFVTQLEVSDSTQFRELREFALANGLSRAMMSPTKLCSEDLLLPEPSAPRYRMADIN
jgi:hypothetical protein